VEELRSKLADVSISSSVGTLQSSRKFSQKSIANKEEVDYFVSQVSIFKKRHLCYTTHIFLTLILV